MLVVELAVVVEVEMEVVGLECQEGVPMLSVVELMTEGDPGWRTEQWCRSCGKCREIERSSEDESLELVGLVDVKVDLV